MPDPRFDGHLDAPSFIDRAGECVDCGRGSDHPNHDGRNPNGHFFNEGTPLLIDRTETMPPRVQTRATTSPVTKNTNEEAVLLDAEPTAIPDESWNEAVAALRKIKYPCARNLCATVLRFAPRAATVLELSTVMRYVHSRAGWSSTTTTTLCMLRKEGLAESELRDGRDKNGHPRVISYWSPTAKLRESFTEQPRGNQLLRFERERRISRLLADTPLEEKIRAKIEWHQQEIRRLATALDVLDEIGEEETAVSAPKEGDHLRGITEGERE